MEEDKDIKILETQIQACKKCKFATCEQCEISYKEVRVIENLIARNKKIEALLEDIDWYFKNQKDNYIPKSKIKDLREQYKNKLDIQDNTTYTFKEVVKSWIDICNELLD